MGFIAKRFSFNRIPCEQFGLRIFDIDGNTNEATPFASTGKLQTDVIPSKGRTFLYGRSFESPLEFNLVFGVDPSEILSMDEHLDRYEMNAIANWLAGHNTYHWLEIEQPDLEMIRYHCVISDLQPIQLSWLPWAFTAKVTCDSPDGLMTYRESLEKEKITLNGNDYVPLEKVKEILDEIENELGVIPNLLKLLY